MHDKLFHTPVALSIDGEKAEIGSLAETHRLLAGWSGNRGADYVNARKACEAGAAGYVTVEQARRAFVSFAEEAGILWPDIEPVVAYRAVARGFGGFAA